jgi:hypothetical protein
MTSIPPIQTPHDVTPVAITRNIGTGDTHASKVDVKDHGKYLSDSTDREDDALVSNNPFADPATAAHWRDVYEKAKYECRHVFDEELTWSKEEEDKIVRKLDWRVCLWAVSIFRPKIYIA